MTFTMSSREFNRKTGLAKKAAENEPVFVTDRRGKPSHVLLSIEEYRRLTSQNASNVTAEDQFAGKTIIDLLAMPGLDQIDDDFEFPEMKGDWGRQIAGS